MKKKLYRVVLVFKFGITHSVFVRARDRASAEKIALRQDPSAVRIDRSPFPQN